MLLASAIGLLAACSYWDWRQDHAAIEELAKKGTVVRTQCIAPPMLMQCVGGRFAWLFDRASNLYDVGKPLDKSDIMKVSQLHHLRTLFLSSGVTDAELELIGRLPRLESLFISSHEVTDAGLCQLRNLVKLRELHLHRCHIRGKGIGNLGNLPNLVTLSLDGNPLEDTELSRLLRLFRLRSLSLMDTSVSNRGMVYLGRLRQLECLDLGGTAVDDAGLVQLQGLIQLRELSLDGTRVGDRGLLEMNCLQKLEMLRFVGSQITRGGIEQFGERWGGTITFTREFPKSRHEEAVMLRKVP